MILLPLLAVAILVAAWWTLRTTPFVSDAAPAGVRGSTSPTGADASRLLRLEEAFGRIESTLASLAAAPRADAPAPERALPPPPTLPSVLQSESLRPVVLGMAKGIDAMGAYRFVRSLRDHSPGAECVIFTDEASLAAEASLREIYDAFGVTVVIFDLARDVPPSAVAWHPSSYRWLLMRDWLRAEADASRLHGSVFFADVRDTIFQGDVFAVAAETPSAGRAFYAFQEQRPMTIAQCGWNSGWVKDCFGVDGLAKVGGNIISCSGTSLASWENARAYADLMADTLLANPGCERNGIDQGMHNYFVYSGDLAARVSELVLIPNEEGFIATVQSMPSLTRDRAGRVLNVAGGVYAVVHQYDRSPALKRQYDAEYVWLGPHEVNLK